MLKYIVTAAGGILFLCCYYFYGKYQNNTKMMRIYALVSYAGLSMVILGGAKVLEPYFDRIPRGMGTTVQFAAEAALFVCGAELLLKPAFEDRIGKKDTAPQKAGGGAKNDGGKSKRVRKRKGKGRNKRKF